MIKVKQLYYSGFFIIGKKNFVIDNNLFNNIFNLCFHGLYICYEMLLQITILLLPLTNNLLGNFNPAQDFVSKNIK